MSTLLAAQMPVVTGPAAVGEPVPRFVLAANPVYSVKRHVIDALPQFVEHGKFALKMYGLKSEPGRDYSDIVRPAQQEIASRIEDGFVDVQSSIGFCVISPDCVNVTFWGKELPSLGHQVILAPNRFNYQGLEGSARRQGIRFERQRDIGKAGSYCAYEAQVLAHESNAWLSFLRSDRSESSLEAYLACSMPRREFNI